MVPIKLNGVAVYVVVDTDGVGVRIRVTADEAEQLGLAPGRQVRVESPNLAGTFLLTASDDAPPFVWLRLLPLASRVAG